MAHPGYPITVACRRPLTINSGPKVFADKLQDALIVYQAGYTAHQDVMINPVEKFRQVKAKKDEKGDGFI